MNEAKNPNPLFMPRTYLTTESNKTGSWRFLRPRYDEKTSPCSATCPAGEDIARIEMLATQGLSRRPGKRSSGKIPFHPSAGASAFIPVKASATGGSSIRPLPFTASSGFLRIRRSGTGSSRIWRKGHRRSRRLP